MKAVVWRGDRILNIEMVEDASLEAPTDVLMRITSSQKFDQRIDGYIKVILDPQR